MRLLGTLEMPVHDENDSDPCSIPALVPIRRVEDLPEFYNEPWLVVPEGLVETCTGRFEWCPAQWKWVPDRHLLAVWLKRMPEVFESAVANGISVPPPPRDMKMNVTDDALTVLFARGCPELKVWVLAHVVPRMKVRRESRKAAPCVQLPLFSG
jgi:hypothetical protein